MAELTKAQAMALVPGPIRTFETDADLAALDGSTLTVGEYAYSEQSQVYSFDNLATNIGASDIALTDGSGVWRLKEDTRALVLDENNDLLTDTEITDGSVTTAKIADGGVTEPKIADQILDGAKVANTAGSGNTTGGLLVVHNIETAGGAGDTDLVIDHKIRVLDITALMLGGGNSMDTIQIKNGANGISGALDISGADTTLVRATSLDDGQTDVAAGGTIRVTQVGAMSPACRVTVIGMRIV